MYQELRMLAEELERLRLAMDEKERPRELPAAADLEQPERRPWWRRMFSS